MIVSRRVLRLLEEEGEEMQRTILALSFALGAANLLADGPAFTQIDYPGSSNTEAWFINNRGDIVGEYVMADKSTHGYQLSGCNFISIDFPGAAYSWANGISPRGDIVGEYAMAVDGSGPHHGFLLTSDGNFSSFDFPGSI